jgi:hypothetical protein
VAAVAFARLADLALLGLDKILSFSLWWPWLTAPFGFATIAYLTRRFFRGAEGSGIPQTIFALRSDSGDAGARLLRPHVVLGRIFLVAGSLLCGGSIGREGPTVHVGALIAHAVGRWMPHGTLGAPRRALILAGGAAGVAAAFNTPLAGVVFAIEELSKSFEERASGVTLTAVILAGVVAIALVGDYTYFGQPIVTDRVSPFGLVTWCVAIGSGIAGGLFSRVTLASVGRLPGALGRLRRQRPALFAGLCAHHRGTRFRVGWSYLWQWPYAGAFHSGSPCTPSVVLCPTACLGDARLLPERHPRRNPGAFAFRRGGDWTKYCGLVRGSDGSFRDSGDVWIPCWRNPGATDGIGHRNGDDLSACNGLALDDHGRSRHRYFTIAIATALPDTGLAVCRAGKSGGFGGCSMRIL